MNQVEYFGRGPEENYIDRNAGTLIDLYKTTADQCTSHTYARRKTDTIPIPVG